MTTSVIASPSTICLGYGTHSKDAPPFLIMHGDRDNMVPYNQRELLDAALKQAGAEVTLYKVVGGGHGGWREPTVQPLVEKFFDKHLKNASIARPAGQTASIPN